MSWVKAVFFLLLISFNLFGQGEMPIEPGAYTIKIDSKSFVRIRGRTNVSTFECSYDSELSYKTFKVGAKKIVDGSTCFDDAVIQLSTGSFDCGLREMTKDFQELLEKEEHPYMTMEVQCMANDLIGGDIIHESEVKFSIAGISNFYTIPFESRRDGDRILCIGRKEINIRDFNIEPPTKLFGLVKVHNIITVEFNIALTIGKDTSMVLFRNTYKSN